MRKTLQFIWIVLFSVCASSLYAQERTVSGKVTDATDGSTLPGVNVTVKGTTTGTVTDVNGNYSVSVPSANSTLVFSFIGLVSQEISVGNRNVIDAVMASDITQLSEVVVTGYGERSVNSYTGAASVLGNDKIQDIPMTTAEQALQGNVAGLQLSATSGTPGSTQNIRIRGVSSITANNEPLFVIDGIPVVSGTNQASGSTGTLGILSSINQNDIENITVLKDAGATAIYGARGANGVIIITTKQGKEGKAVINFSAQYGSVARAVEGPKMLNSAQWEEMYYESLVNGGYAVDAAQAEALYPSGWDGVTDTDWNKAVKNQDAATQSYDISMRGGNDKTNYYASIGYMQQDGVNIGSDYERLSAKITFSSKLTDKMTFSNSTSPSFVTQIGQLEGSAYFGSPDAAYLFTWPIDKALNDDGTPNLNLGTSTYNPLYVANSSINERKQTRILNSSSFGFEIIDGLKFTSTFGFDYLTTDELYFDDRNYGDGFNAPGDPNNGQSYMYNNRNFNYDWKNMVDYTYRLNDDHVFDFKLVYEAQKNTYKRLGSGGVGFAADGLIYPSSVGTIDFGQGYVNDWAINSFMGLVNYTFKGNIFIDATLRREGNSRFADGKRWGTFYSFGASWVFSDEAFLSGINWLNTSKIRASYGRTGNAGVGLNQYQATLSYANSYVGEAGASPGNFGNKDLTWENQNSYNFALDFGIFDRLTGTVEYFVRDSYDLLLDVPLSRTTGFTSQYANVGRMENKGIELTLNANIIDKGGFKWDIGGNFTSLKNEVTEMPVDGNGDELPISGSTTIVTVGQPVYAWRHRTWAGVNPQTGEPLWNLDESGATTSNYASAEMQYQGGSALPTEFGGVNTRLEYKGIYASANMYFSYGNKAYDSWAFYTQSDGRFTYSVSSGYARLYDRWQQPGDISENPQNIYNNTSSSNSNSSRRLYDAGFMRLRNVTIGYNLPTSLISKIKLSSASIYVMGTNLWTQNKDPRLEFDPEIKSDGFLSLNAPPLKTMVMGIRIGL